MLWNNSESIRQKSHESITGWLHFFYDSEITFEIITFESNKFYSLPDNFVKKHDVVSKLHVVETNFTY